MYWVGVTKEGPVVHKCAIGSSKTLCKPPQRRPSGMIFNRSCTGGHQGGSAVPKCAMGRGCIQWGISSLLNARGPQLRIHLTDKDPMRSGLHWGFNGFGFIERGSKGGRIEIIRWTPTRDRFHGDPIGDGTDPLGAPMDWIYRIQ